MNETEEEKLFSRSEILAMGMLCAATCALIMADNNFANEIEGRQMVEKSVNDIIDIRWNHPTKRNK